MKAVQCLRSAKMKIGGYLRESFCYYKNTATKTNCLLRYSAKTVPNWNSELNRNYYANFLFMTWSKHELSRKKKQIRNELRSFRQFRKRCLRSRRHNRHAAAAESPLPNNITQVCYSGFGLLRVLSGRRRSIRIFWDKKIINEKYWKKDARRQW